MSDPLSKLPEMTWRGLKYPTVGATFLRRWESVAHQSLQAQFPEFVGPTNWLFTYTLAMRRGIATDYGRDLFSGIVQLRDDCEKRERGDLKDPLWGVWKCMATEFSGDIDPTRRDGVDVKVSFLHKPELDDPDTQPAAGVMDIGQLGASSEDVDEQIKVLYKHQTPPMELGINPLDAINGIGRQIARQGDKISQALHKFARKCESLEATVAALGKPETFGIRRALRRNRAAAYALIKRANDVGQQTTKIVLRYAKSALAIASENKMTIQQLLTLNPGLAKTPMVPAGTAVVVHARS